MDSSTQIYRIAQTLGLSQQVELLQFAEFLQKRQPPHNDLSQAFHLLTQLPADCFEEQRIDPLPEEREWL